MNRMKPDTKSIKVSLAGLPMPAAGFGSGSMGYSKANFQRKLFSPVMPSLQPFPQRAQLTDYFHRCPGNSMHSIRKLDDRRHWILSFDTFQCVGSLPLNVFGSILCRFVGLYRDKHPLSLHTKGPPAWQPCWALLRNGVDGASRIKAAWW